MSGQLRPVLVHLGGGIGNVVLATPLLIALHELGFTVDVLLAADYSETAELLRPWSVVRSVFSQAEGAPAARNYSRVLPAIPPFYFVRYGRALARCGNALPRPPDELFYRDEQAFFLSFAHTLGYPAERRPAPSLPIAPQESLGVTAATVVLAPGCKTGEMAAKRWPWFGELAETFEDVAVVGTTDDLFLSDGSKSNFPSHVRSFVGCLSLRETAGLMASAGVVVGNDSGLSHVAAAVGTPTILLFGPTPHLSLGALPANATLLRSGLPCEPCWFRERFNACRGRIDCLRSVTVDMVVRMVETAIR